MKILFATLDTYELDEKSYTSYRAHDEEHSFELIEKEKIDAIILEEKFVQKMPWREYFLKIRTRFPHTRMVVLWEKEDANELDFLYKWMAFDVLIKED
jgi:DNA-binding NarL/FixJ family response regulator